MRHPPHFDKKEKAPRKGQNSPLQNAFVPVTIIILNAEKDSSDSCTKCGYTDPLFSCSKQTHPVGKSVAFCRLLPGQNAGRPRQGGPLMVPAKSAVRGNDTGFPGTPEKEDDF